eukprot:TRINITY_DN3545_c0_g1_i1.p2 TRINITY_DN3545_c0_g1~~TRINITY_DN3545_c0_g1_i1.p2  ORF type:complete len:108 (+),score=17.06 TRINITY_DN3545_c0_g1_i1:375-698(+)
MPMAASRSDIMLATICLKEESGITPASRSSIRSPPSMYFSTASSSSAAHTPNQMRRKAVGWRWWGEVRAVWSQTAAIECSESLEEYVCHVGSFLVRLAVVVGCCKAH